MTVKGVRKVQIACNFEYQELDYIYIISRLNQLDIIHMLNLFVNKLFSLCVTIALFVNSLMENNWFGCSTCGCLPKLILWDLQQLAYDKGFRDERAYPKLR